VGNFVCFHGSVHIFVVARTATVNAALAGEATMSLNNSILRQAGFAFQAVDVLRKRLEQQAFIVQKRNKAVGNGGPKLSGVQLASQGVKRKRVLSEEIQLENRLRIWEVELLEVCVETGPWRPKVWDSSRGADAGTDLRWLDLVRIKMSDVPLRRSCGPCPF
jgi:hypothetical protein